MTTVQMKHFITLATCLSFTEAASQLYISQSALSRQIVSLERELNLQLFIRDTHSMRLTPAGEALFEDVKELYSRYLQAVERAQTLQRGVFGTLTIGVLDGHRVSETFPDLVGSIQREHPSLSVNLFRGSFHDLTTALYDGRADFIITLEFSLRDKPQLARRSLSPTRDFIVTLRSNPLAEVGAVRLEDLREQTIIAISPEDSPAAYEGMRELHRRAGCTVPLRVAPNLETLTLWVQAGLGISILNDFNGLAQDEDLAFLNWEVTEDIPVHATDLVLAWRKDNMNPAAELFLRSIFENK